MTPASALPLTRDIVLIGGGHAHALLLRAWGMQPLAGARLTVINPAPTAPYTGMLPGHIAGHYARDDLEIDLVRLASHAGARLILGRAEGIDRAAGRIHVAGRPPVAYDVASIDIGITSDMPEVPGFTDHAAAVKPLAGYAARWRDFLAGPPPAGAQVVVIGGGVAGCECAMAMAWRLRREHPGAGGVTVIEAAPAVLRDLGARARAAVLAAMQRLGVTVLTGAQVERIEAGAVVLADGRRLPAAFVLGAAGARPHGWLAATGLHLTDGHVTVDGFLRSITDPAIFAVGDCAHLQTGPRPKAGVYAVRQAPVLLHNLRAAVGAGRMMPYRAQADYLRLISTGGRSAVADKHGLSVAGDWLWRLKDGIDARFMARLRDLPPMPGPDAPELAATGAKEGAAAPLCGGCGAKVGAGALGAALARLHAVPRADLLAGPGDDAAILSLPGGGVQVLTTDSLRSVTDDPYLMGRIATVHALGDIWAMGAVPQAALVTVTLPRMSPSLAERTLAEVLEAVSEVLGAEGAAVAGGHTALGAEFALGLTITGLMPEGRAPLTKAGARPGDALILTRPIGTGTLLAAAMQRAAEGPDIAAALDAMATPQGAAAAVLAPVAHVMTDVTGFGLAGHLAEMLRASGVSAALDPGTVPVLAGALAAAAGGHASVLAPENRAAVAGLAELGDGPRAALLVDPQTSGGLLAAVPADRARALLDALHAAGFAHAARIGSVGDGPPRLQATGAVAQGRGPALASGATMG